MIQVQVFQEQVNVQVYEQVDAMMQVLYAQVFPE